MSFNFRFVCSSRIEYDQGCHVAPWIALALFWANTMRCRVASLTPQLIDRSVQCRPCPKSEPIHQKSVWHLGPIGFSCQWQCESNFAADFLVDDVNWFTHWSPSDIESPFKVIDLSISFWIRPTPFWGRKITHFPHDYEVNVRCVNSVFVFFLLYISTQCWHAHANFPGISLQKSAR